ncbi:MAG TPA: hypothetical protein VFC82_11835 [Actinomycetaceae bacterium]|nr:hypothetical protein [Actinomycetaceae bacterium]
MVEESNIPVEQLTDHEVWRRALSRGEIHHGAAQAIGRHIAGAVFDTSVFGMERDAFVEEVLRSANPERRREIEIEVFTEPIDGPDRHSWLESNLHDVLEMRADRSFTSAVSDAKYMFMTQAEAFLHGDLDTGTILVRKPDGSQDADSVVVVDSLSPLYGPGAFDLGTVWAGYVIAAARGYAFREDERARWCLSLVVDTWDAFEWAFRERWPERRETRLWDDYFLERLLHRWRNEAWLYSSPRLARHAMDAAKTKDTESLPLELREGAVRGALRIARSVSSERWVDSAPEHYRQLSEWLLVEARTA